MRVKKYLIIHKVSENVEKRPKTKMWWQHTKADVGPALSHHPFYPAVGPISRQSSSLGSKQKVKYVVDSLVSGRLLMQDASTGVEDSRIWIIYLMLDAAVGNFSSFTLIIAE